MLSLLVAISLAAGDRGGAQPAEAPLAQPYKSPKPRPDIEALVFLGAQPRERHRCSVTALVDPFGEVLDAAPTSCPRELENSSVDAVRGWKFHPPMQGDKAVRGRYEVTFVYVAQSVRVPEHLQGDRLVRAEPTVVPRWPKPPPTRGGARDWMDERGVSEARCVLDFSVDKRSAPQDFVAVDCPEVLFDPLMRRLKRYGVDVVGGSPGDGKLYRLEWVYTL